MKRTVKAVAKLTGISVRTLHYYDEIGLFRPDEISEAGYRLYDDASLGRLQQILFFRELEFPLREIAEILNNPAFDQAEALKNHRKLLLLKRGRLDRLIRLVDSSLKGDNVMSFQEFDLSEIENARRSFAGEARARWGNTAAYAQSNRKTGNYSGEDWIRISAEADEILRALAKIRKKGAPNPAVQKLTEEWRVHICRNYYDCTPEIFAGLGKLYASDSRFAGYFERYGEGFPSFLSEAIRAWAAAPPDGEKKNPTFGKSNTED